MSFTEKLDCFCVTLLMDTNGKASKHPRSRKRKTTKGFSERSLTTNFQESDPSQSSKIDLNTNAFRGTRQGQEARLLASHPNPMKNEPRLFKNYPNSSNENRQVTTSESETSDGEVDSERTQELEAIQSIFPELRMTKKYGGSIDIPVTPISPISVVFNHQPDVYTVQHLPPLKFSFGLSKKYPLDVPPRISLKSSWMAQHSINKLVRKLVSLWTESHDQVLFSMIDTLNQDMTGDLREYVSSPLVLNNSNKQQVLSFDVLATRQEFANHTFQCDICQYVKKGVQCTQLQACNHVFCTDCLKAYFTACVVQGYISQVICPQPDCASPELAETELEQLIGGSLKDRFVELRNKKAVESNPNSFLFCPSEVCQALVKRNPDDLLTICPKCDFAFCSVCKRSWHGYYEYCRMQEPPKSLIEKYIDGDETIRKKIDIEWGYKNMQRYMNAYEAEKSFRDYMESNNNRACPKCLSPIEKSMGCNKMTCSICHTYFCFLCADILDKENPYHHYGDERSRCYHKLFEGTEIQEPEPEDLFQFAF
jgi:E3 ubiquitin-protein ligase RNF14